jgi:hypothetical protein
MAPGLNPLHVPEVPHTENIPDMYPHVPPAATIVTVPQVCEVSLHRTPAPRTSHAGVVAPHVAPAASGAVHVPLKHSSVPSHGIAFVHAVPTPTGITQWPIAQTSRVGPQSLSLVHAALATGTGAQVPHVALPV